MKPVPSDLPEPGASVDAEAIEAEFEPCGFVFATSIEARPPVLTPEAQTVIAWQLRSHLYTHRSIRLLTGKHEEHPEMLADAFSLLREQIERVFVVIRLLYDPEVWERRYAADDARREIYYEIAAYLERGHLPRFKDFYEGPVFNHLRSSAALSSLTPEQVRRAVHMALDPDGELPPELRDSAHNIPSFPTPKSVEKSFKGHPVEPMLRRWNVEYMKRSGHTHLGLDKLLYAKERTPETRREDHQRRIIEDQARREVIIVSWLAGACIFAETLAVLRPALKPSLETELARRLVALWDRLRPLSLLGLALWDLRVKDLVPALTRK